MACCETFREVYSHRRGNKPTVLNQSGGGFDGRYYLKEYEEQTVGRIYPIYCPFCECEIGRFGIESMNIKEA